MMCTELKGGEGEKSFLYIVSAKKKLKNTKVLSKSFIYQLMHNRVALNEY